jgi:glycosyl transferase, family 25
MLNSVEKIWDWSLVEKVVYINLKHRTDRKAVLLENLASVQIPKEKIVRFNAVSDEESSTLNCTKSHREVIAMARECGWGNVLVLEDDMIFNNSPSDATNFCSFMQKLNKQNWDVAMLSGLYYIIHAIDPPLHRIKFAYGGNSYLVNQHYYSKLINNFDENISNYHQPEGAKSLDLYWLTLLEHDNWMGMHPCAGGQASGYSDIEKQHRDWSTAFKKSKDSLKKYGST